MTMQRFKKNWEWRNIRRNNSRGAEERSCAARFFFCGGKTAAAEKKAAAPRAGVRLASAPRRAPRLIICYDSPLQFAESGDAAQVVPPDLRTVLGEQHHQIIALKIAFFQQDPGGLTADCCFFLFAP